ncbi:hypothetical protein HDV00_003783 [Rhizophlyctis rosea]|nr:hypothetical protein HDV00_003783 [Rhizophlyctis rosea]
MTDAPRNKSTNYALRSQVAVPAKYRDVVNRCQRREEDRQKIEYCEATLDDDDEDSGMLDDDGGDSEVEAAGEDGDYDEMLSDDDGVATFTAGSAEIFNESNAPSPTLTPRPEASPSPTLTPIRDPSSSPHLDQRSDGEWEGEFNAHHNFIGRELDEPMEETDGDEEGEGDEGVGEGAGGYTTTSNDFDLPAVIAEVPVGEASVMTCDGGGNATNIERGQNSGSDAAEGQSLADGYVGEVGQGGGSHRHRGESNRWMVAEQTGLGDGETVLPRRSRMSVTENIQCTSEHDAELEQLAERFHSTEDEGIRLLLNQKNKMAQ